MKGTLCPSFYYVINFIIVMRWTRRSSQLLWMRFITIRGTFKGCWWRRRVDHSNIKLWITTLIIIFPCRSLRRRKGLYAKHAGHTQTRQDNRGELRMSLDTVLDWSSGAGHYSGERDNNIIQKKQTKLETT